MHQLETVLGDLVPELALDELANFPEFSNKTDLQALAVSRKKEVTLRLISAFGIGLFNKPSGSRGILNELTELSETFHFSSILKELFLEQSPPLKKVIPRSIFTPVTLSDNQLNIFHSFDQYQSTLVVGPPGTGKSFTIAALTADLISHGKSVLIASKNDQAGKVIAKKIEEDFGLKNMVLKTASGRFKNSLRTRLENISNGLRKGQNPVEASAILTYIKTIIQKEKSLPKKLCQSIGILSPFRSQVTFLKTKIGKSITAQDIRRHRLLIGTPHHFQGEERDLMFLSFVVDDQTHPSTYLYLNRADVFNVSVTRARLAQHLFFSVSARELPSHYLLTQYLQQTQQTMIADHTKEKESEEDKFMEEVVTALKKWKVQEIFPNYAIAGIKVDLVVINQDKSFCIDLVGYPGDFEDIWPVNRIKLMSRIDIPTFTLPYTAWYTDKKRAGIALKKFLKY